MYGQLDESQQLPAYTKSIHNSTYEFFCLETGNDYEARDNGYVQLDKFELSLAYTKSIHNRLLSFSVWKPAMTMKARSNGIYIVR